MYRFYLKQGQTQFLFPVTPAKLEVKTDNQNETVSILNVGQVNILKGRGLEEIRFTALFPNRPYGFVQTQNQWKDPSYYIQILQTFQEAKLPVQLTVFRQIADGSLLFSDNREMALEQCTMTEKGGEQGDIWVDIVLKEYRRSQSIAYKPLPQNTGNANHAVQQNVQRPAKTPAKTYVVQKGDSLWKIAKKELGNGSKYREIAKKNNIQNPSLIYPGKVLQL